jgi:hypothetical protein
MSGTPLPPKVAASGLGYTLSGNLLDPTSAAAAAYGFSYSKLLERECEGGGACCGGGKWEGVTVRGQICGRVLWKSQPQLPSMPSLHPPADM